MNRIELFLKTTIKSYLYNSLNILIFVNSFRERKIHAHKELFGGVKYCLFK